MTLRQRSAFSPREIRHPGRYQEGEAPDKDQHPVPTRERYGRGPRRHPEHGPTSGKSRPSVACNRRGREGAFLRDGVPYRLMFRRSPPERTGRRAPGRQAKTRAADMALSVARSIAPAVDVPRARSAQLGCALAAAKQGASRSDSYYRQTHGSTCAGGAPANPNISARTSWCSTEEGCHRVSTRGERSSMASSCAAICCSVRSSAAVLMPATSRISLLSLCWRGARCRSVASTIPSDTRRRAVRRNRSTVFRTRATSPQGHAAPQVRGAACQRRPCG